MTKQALNPRVLIASLGKCLSACVFLILFCPPRTTRAIYYEFSSSDASSSGATLKVDLYFAGTSNIDPNTIQFEAPTTPVAVTVLLPSVVDWDGTVYSVCEATFKEFQPGDTFRFSYPQNTPDDPVDPYYMYENAGIEGSCSCTITGTRLVEPSWNELVWVVPAGSGSPNPSVGGASTFTNDSAHLKFSLGNQVNGSSAGSIQLNQQVLTTNSYSTASLAASQLGGTIVLHTTSADPSSALASNGSYLRQVLSGDVLADIITQSATKYSIAFYHAAQVVNPNAQGGLYTTGGAPFVTYTIENPDASGNTTTQLKVTESRPPQADNVSLFAIDASGSSTLTTGNGTWRDSKVRGTDSTGNATIDHTVQSLVGSTTVMASRTIDTYGTFPWGQSLIQEVIDPDGAKLTTTYTYYTDPDETNHYGQVQSITKPDGSWEIDDWNGGTQIETLTPWKDGPAKASDATVSNCHATLVSNPTTGGSETDEYILGQQVSRTVTGINSNTGATTSTVFVSAADTAGLTTTTTNNSDGTVAEVDSPNGTVERHSYTTINFQGATATRELVRHGTASLASGIAGTSVCNVNVTSAAGRLLLEQTYVSDASADPSTTASNLIAQTTHAYDASGNPTQDTDLNGNVTYQAGWAGNLKQWEKDAQGIETDYTYDNRNRVLTSIKKGASGNSNYADQPDIVTTYGYDATDRQTNVTVTAGSLTQVSTTGYDLAGRVVSQTQGGLETDIAYAPGGHPFTVTNPNGSTRVTDYYLDGQTKSVTGTAQVATSYDYQLNSANFRQSLVTTGPSGSTRTVITTTDWAGRTVEVDIPAFGGGTAATVSFYNALGQLYRFTRPGLADTLYVYDALGNQTMSGLDMDGNGTLDTGSSSPDRVSATNIGYSNGCRVATTTVYGDTSVPTAQTIQTERLTGLPVGTLSQVTVAGPNGTTQTTTTVNTAGKLVTITTTVPGATNPAVQVAYNGLPVSASTPAVPSPVLSTYDALGRPSTRTDPGTGAVTTIAYDLASGQVASVATANGALGTSTVNTYYGPGEASPGQLKTANVNGLVTAYTYNLQNQVTSVSGNTYPLSYGYDGYGALQTLTTTGAAGNATTTWVYDPATGLQTQKLDNSQQGPTYTYWPSGQVKTRTWARGVTTTYSYDGAGGRVSVVYSDGTPGVTITNNRQGQPASVTDAAGTHALTYTADGQLAGDAIAGGGGLLAGIGVQASYDGALRRHALNVTGVPGLSYAVGYGYDGATGNLASVTDNASGSSATYGYQPNSARLATTTFQQNGAVRLTTTRVPDGLGRLASISNVAGSGGTVSAHAYTYNAQSQRAQVTLADGSYWLYGYNARGELTGGHHYWSTGRPVAGQQFDYGFDAIGNRTSTVTNGRTASYTSNALNQYTSRQVPGAVDVLGIASPTAAVRVNNLPADSRDAASGYFYKALGVDNANGAVDQGVDVLAFAGGAGPGGADVVSETQGSVFVAQTPESYTYDLDGNLVQDGRWTYTWDAESRLIGMTANANVTASAKKKLLFVYGWMGRRIGKQVYGWNEDTSNYVATPSTSVLFVYDGWNLVAELNGGNGNAPLRSYLWGQDMSGSLQGAGGVGGVLSLTDYTGNSVQAHYACYDGNGDIMGLVQASDGSASALYAYNAFGELLQVSSGSNAITNPICWSTKYRDEETGAIYYGYRYYVPSIGRWINRDLISESGGTNLYAFVRNNPSSNFDLVGLASCRCECPEKISLGNPAGHNITNGFITSRLPYQFDMSYVTCGAAASGKPAKLEWFETTNIPLQELVNLGAKPNVQYDAYDLTHKGAATLGGIYSNFFDPWDRRRFVTKKSFDDTSDTIFITDTPSQVQKAYVENNGQYLDITIRITADKDCPCQPNKVQQSITTRWRIYKNGSGAWTLNIDGHDF